MRVTILPLANVLGFADTATGEIFMSYRAMLSPRCPEYFAHELAHINSGDPDHGPGFCAAIRELGFEPPPGEDVFKSMRKRLGMHNRLRSCSANIGNIVGQNQQLLDLHLLASYRKFAQKILGTEGHWEVVNEVNGNSAQQLIRLYPTPKGSYPVMVIYHPVVTHFRSPQAKKLAYDMLLAEAKCMLGAARRKLTGIPTPDGGSISYDGEALAQEGQKEKDEIIQKALLLGEPDRIFVY